MGKRRNAEMPNSSAKHTKLADETADTISIPTIKDSSGVEERHSVSLDDIKQQVVVPGSDFRELLRDTKNAPHEPSISELEELDHIVINAAYQIEQLMTKFGWLRAVDFNTLSLQTSDPMAKSLMTRYRIRLAAMLVQQYWNSGIPAFDYLISTRKQHNIPISQIVTGELSSSRLDELQALLLQAAIDSIKVMKQRVKGDNEFFTKTSQITHDLKKAVKNKKKNFPNDQDGTNKNGTNKNGKSADLVWPPPLPEINDESLLQQVFTHRSAIVDSNMSSRADLLNIHNERLEFKGDSILDFIVCDMLYNMFPTASEGTLSIMKSSLVCNDTLFDLSVAYKLHERIKVSSDLHGKIFGPDVPFSVQTALPDASKKNKAVADVFEAYIAGVAINQGLMEVQTWLHKLYAPLVESIQNNAHENAVEDVDKNAKNELYRKIGSADQSITYVALNDSPPFTVVCRVNGEEIAKGTDRTVKIAGLRAAEAVLKQPKLVEKYASMRRSIPKTVPTTGSLVSDRN